MLYVKVREMPDYERRTFAVIQYNRPGFEPGGCEWPRCIQMHDKDSAERFADYLARDKPELYTREA